MPDQEIINLILHYRYFIIFPLALVEGPIITLIVGFLISLNYFNFFSAFFVIALADIVVDILFFMIGRHGGAHVLNGYGRYIGLNEKRIEYAKSFLDKHKNKALYLSKFVHGFSIPTLFCLGASEISFKKILPTMLSVSFIKTLLLILAGVFFGQSFNILRLYLDHAYAFTIVIVLVIIVALLLRTYFKKREVGI